MSTEETLKLHIAEFLDEEDRLFRWPGKRYILFKPYILAYLATKFTMGHVYTEHEVNEILRAWHTFDDWALLRRELFMIKLLDRKSNGSAYWLTGKTLSDILP